LFENEIIKPCENYDSIEKENIKKKLDPKMSFDMNNGENENNL